MTFNVAVELCVSEPLVPVIVSVEDPTGVPGEAVTVIVEVPDPVTAVGLNLAVVPVGRPVTEKVTDALNPFAGVIVTSQLSLLACQTVCEVGEAAMLKST